MSEQTDGRSLVGGYSCRDVPGQFTWEDGVLTTAVREGHWLLIEDVDMAPADVTATLVPLTGEKHETGYSSVINNRPVTFSITLPEPTLLSIR